MAKTCKSCGRSPVWAKDLCKGCQWKRPDIKKFINSKSTKRKDHEKEYFKIIKQIHEEALSSSGDDSCFLCGKAVKRADIHHITGRDGDRLTDRANLVRVHRTCHTKFHSLSVAQLEKEGWYDDFLQRLEKVNEVEYNKQINKKLK